MKRANIYIETYDCGNGFLMDFVHTDGTYEGWIYHRDYGVKDLIFGLPMTQSTRSEALDLLQYNLENGIESYRKQYMQIGYDS